MKQRLNARAAAFLSRISRAIRQGRTYTLGDLEELASPGLSGWAPRSTVDPDVEILVDRLLAEEVLVEVPSSISGVRPGYRIAGDVILPRS